MGVRWTATGLLACCVLGVAASAGGQTWSLRESGSIRVITNVSPEAGARVLDHLVVTRSLLTQAASVEPALPLVVFVLKDGQALSELAPPQLKRGDFHTFGFSHTGAHAAFIAIRADRPEPEMLGTLRHEYVHALAASRSADIPAWLDEGLAEFWGAVIVDGDRAVIGRPVARHLDELRRRTWLPLDAMLNQPRGSVPSSPDRVRMFYAQSWAMVHYLLLGQNAAGPGSFMPPANNLSLQFETTLRRYITDGGVREVSAAWRPPVPVAVMESTLSEAQARAERANMLVSGTQLDGALAEARRALALNPGEPLALEVIGAYYFLSNEPQQARVWLGRSLAARVTYRAALYLSLLATSAADRERYLALAVLSKPDSAVAWQRLRGIFEADGRLETSRRWCAAWTALPVSRFFFGQSTPFCPGVRQ